LGVFEGGKDALAVAANLLHGKRQWQFRELDRAELLQALLGHILHALAVDQCAGEDHPTPLVVGVEDLSVGIGFVEAEIRSPGEAGQGTAELAFERLPDSGLVGHCGQADGRGEQEWHESHGDQWSVSR
jgi:hypothetical protein